MPSFDVRVSQTDIGDIVAQLPDRLRNGAVRSAMVAAARPVWKLARETVRQEKDPTNFAKKSRKQQQAYGTNNLEKALGSAVRVYKRSGNVVAIVGGRAPGGPHAHLLEQGHDAVYWGRPAAETEGPPRVAGTRFLKRAGDSTESQQFSAAIDVLKRKINDEPLLKKASRAQPKPVRR